MGSNTSAVLFDIDGTLVDSTYHHALAWHRAFTRLGHVPALWRIHRSIGIGGDKFVAQVAGPEVEDRHGDDLRDSWRQEYLRVRAEVRPLEGAAKLIRALSDDGMRIGLASSGDPQFAREAIDLIGIGDRIEVLTTSVDADGSKPEPDLIAVTLDRMSGVEQAVFVGDTPYDVEAANRAGVGCIALLTGGFSSAELVEAGASLVAEAPDALFGTPWRAYLTRLQLPDGTGAEAARHFPDASIPGAAPHCPRRLAPQGPCCVSRRPDTPQGGGPREMTCASMGCRRTALARCLLSVARAGSAPVTA